MPREGWAACQVFAVQNGKGSASAKSDLGIKIQTAAHPSPVNYSYLLLTAHDEHLQASMEYPYCAQSTIRFRACHLSEHKAAPWPVASAS